MVRPARVAQWLPADKRELREIPPVQVVPRASLGAAGRTLAAAALPLRAALGAAGRMLTAAMQVQPMAAELASQPRGVLPRRRRSKSRTGRR